MDSESIDALEDVDINVKDLGGVTLAVANGSVITLDDDAAGHGWFIDATPGDDEEFSSSNGEGTLTASAPEAAQMDLLTVILHELGHVLGLNDTFDQANFGQIMHLPIQPGERRLPTASDVDQVFTNQDDVHAIVFGHGSH